MVYIYTYCHLQHKCEIFTFFTTQNPFGIGTLLLRSNAFRCLLAATDSCVQKARFCFLEVDRVGEREEI